MCARLAARTVLELASVSAGEDLQGWGHLVLHFLMQHAASCHIAVMQLLASAAVIIAERQARGLADILLLLQKLLANPHVEQQRAGLVLSGRVLRSKLLESADTEMVLAGMARMPFQPSWPAAQHLYRAAMHASSALPANVLGHVLSKHVRPAAVQAGLVSTECEADLRNASNQVLHAASSANNAYILTIHKYVMCNTSAGVCAASAACDLLRCLVMLEGGADLSAYAAAACEWDVEMPAQLWDDLGQPSVQVSVGSLVLHCFVCVNV
jgi:hypothetical protein